MDYFDQIYLINLERRPLKLIQSLWQLSTLNPTNLTDNSSKSPKKLRYTTLKNKLQIIKAVDGWHPKYYYQPKSQLISHGAYGYILSWINVLTHAKEQRFKKILILDDDFILKKNFEEECTSWLKRLDENFKNQNTNQNPNQNKNWKIILLGASQHTQPDKIISEINAYYPRLTDGSFAVGIDKTVYDELLELLSKHDKLVDSHALRHLYAKFNDQCFVAYPNLIIADVSQSDIRQSRDQIQHSQKLGWNLDDYQFEQIQPLNQIKRPVPLVSLIMPVYQAEKTIKRSLQSILDQTYRPLEIIIVDDGSSDQTFKEISQIIEEWMYHPKSRDLTFKVFHQEKNRGCYASRNIGLKHATGQLITFQDSDDISLNHRIERQVIEILKHETWMVSCQFIRTHLTHLSTNPEQLERDLNRSLIHQSYCCRAKIGLVTLMFQREVFERYGNYPEDAKWGSDATFLEQIFPEVKTKQTKMMNYLNDHTNLPPKYHQIEEVLYLSHEMTDQNLTIQRLQATQNRKTKA